MSSFDAAREWDFSNVPVSIALAKGDGVVQEEAHYVDVADVENVPGDLGIFEKHLTTGIGCMVIGVFFGTEELPDHPRLYVKVTLISPW